MLPGNNGGWQATIHFYAATYSTASIQWRDTTVATIDVVAADVNAPFPAKFDDFVTAVNEMEGGYAEGDGSYGIVGQGGAWKICGNIYENLDAIQYVELLGHCPVEKLAEFIQLLGCEKQQCVFQILQGGFFQSFEQFVGTDVPE